MGLGCENTGDVLANGFLASLSADSLSSSRAEARTHQSNETFVAPVPLVYTRGLIEPAFAPWAACMLGDASASGALSQRLVWTRLRRADTNPA